MAAPSYIAKSAFASGTAALSVGAVAGVVADDLILLFIESENQAVPSTPTGGAGGTWAQVTGSPQGTGTERSASATRLTMYYQVATGADATTTVADTGDHTCAIKICIRGADVTTPFDATSGGVQATAATTLNMPSVTTTVADCLIVYGIALNIDGASTARMGTLTNAALTSLTERHDQTVATADGGGIGVITGVKATAGVVGTTTVAVTSTIATYLTMAIKPAPNAYSLTAETRTYSYSGNNANTLFNRSVIADTGSFTYSGNNATLTYATGLNNYTITADAGGFTYSGNNANVLFNRKVVAEAGTYTYAGNNANVLFNRKVVAEAGGYTYAGNSANTIYNRRVVAEAGSFTYSGNNANTVFNRRVVAEAGGYTYSGNAANTLYNRVLKAPSSNLTSLLHFDGTSGSQVFTDVVGITWTATGNAQLSNTQSKFGGTSAYFDGSGDYITADNSSLKIGTGDFTIEAWLYRNTSATHNIISWSSNNAIYMNAGSDVVFIQTGGTNRIQLAGKTGEWFHVALCRSNGVLTAFIDGVKDNETPTITTDFTGTNLEIGRRVGSTNTFNGWVDEFRFVNGAALYSDDFTPLNKPFEESRFQYSGADVNLLREYRVIADAGSYSYYQRQL